MRRTKSYNPFSMWGTLAGFILGVILAYISLAAVLALCEFGRCQTAAYFLPVIPLVMGFFLGWGVHSFLRWRA